MMTTMRFATLMKHPASWMTSMVGDGIVLTSRIRLARNIVGFSFPGWSLKEEREKIFNVVYPAVCSAKEFQKGFASGLTKLKNLEKLLLVERHLISSEHSAKADGCGVVVSRDQGVSVMINEEDHLRIQAISSGLALDETWKRLNALDSYLETQLPYAYDENWGYLTSCPTNVGTGLRASVMMHLPGLALHGEMEKVLNAVSRLGLTVRGIYGEGSEAVGNIYQLSNQQTLGMTEEEIIGLVQRVVSDICLREQEVRQKIYRENSNVFHDNLGRAWGILRYGHILDSQEALTLLSCLIMGADSKHIPIEQISAFYQLMLEIQPGHLRWKSTQESLSAEMRDVMRAQIVRQELAKMDPPFDII